MADRLRQMNEDEILVEVMKMYMIMERLIKLRKKLSITTKEGNPSLKMTEMEIEYYARRGLLLKRHYDQMVNDRKMKNTKK